MSDLFTERNQFDMMFSTLMELHRLHPPEDEILNQYLVPAICKAAAVLGMVSPAEGFTGRGRGQKMTLKCPSVGQSDR